MKAKEIQILVGGSVWDEYEDFAWVEESRPGFKVVDVTLGPDSRGWESRKNRAWKVTLRSEGRAPRRQGI